MGDGDNGILSAFYSLGKKINKRFGNEQDPETEEGVVSEQLPELTLDMGDEELLKLKRRWQKSWLDSEVYAEWQKHRDENEDYWLGKHFQQPRIDKTRALVDNVIFEALETYLPQVTQHNPEPLVTLAGGEEQTPENLDFAQKMKQKLADLADKLRFRLKLKKAGRHWAIYLLAVGKLGWDLDEDSPTVKIIRPHKFILDPNSTVDEDGYNGKFLGEHRTQEAAGLIKLLKAIGGEEGAEKAISELVEGELGTDVGFIEWWTNEMIFWTLKDDHVLFKKKNPHWNYDQDVPVPQMGEQEMGAEQMQPGQEPGAPAVPELAGGSAAEAPEAQGEEQSADQGQPEPETQKIPGHNHFAKPQMPYVFLSVFNLGDQPVDKTSLIGQNLASQDLINKRVKQIDKIADSMYGGMVVSGEKSGLNQQQSKGVTSALRKGGTIYIPSGSVSEAIARMSAPPLPRDVYEQLTDTRGRVAYIFGTKGFQPVQGGGQSAVRSQILNKNLDEARISGGFAEYLEQFGDDIYNWFVQLLYVYDDKFANQPHPKIVVSIKEGSLLPKDSTALSQQAINLGQSGRMALIDVYKKLEYPNPEEMAANVWLEANAPEILFANDPRVAQAIQQKQQAAQGNQKPPSESINFKDLPPDGKAQMAKKAGIDLHPEGIAAHDDVVHERSKPPEPTPPAPVLNNGYVQPQ